MLTVHIWSPKVALSGKSVGHAAITLNTEYISWWPESGMLNVSPYRVRSLAMDVHEEDGRAPMDTIIHGLDESAILQWWSGFGLQASGEQLQGPMPAYNVLKQSCATVASTALRIGGGDKFAGWWSRTNMVWSPLDVHRYAQAICTGMRQSRE